MTVVSPKAPAPEVTALRSSPLAHRAAELAARSVHGRNGVRLHEEPYLAQVNVRVHPGSPAAARTGQTLGRSLPTAPGDVRGDIDGAVLWLGPDEWLVVGPDGSAPRLAEAQRTAIGEEPGSVVDVSANRTTLRLSGPRARDVLEKVCSLDLHPRAFGPGRCAQTLLGRAQVVLWQVTAEPGYRVLVRGSFAGYLADLLLDAMAEFS